MPVMISTGSAGEASLRLTFRLRWCTNGRYRGSSLSASGKPIASAKVAPRPTTAALMCSQSEIEYRLKTASIARTLVVQQDGRRRGEFGGSGDQPVRTGVLELLRRADAPGRADRRQPVRPGGEDVERAISDHHGSG